MRLCRLSWIGNLTELGLWQGFQPKHGEGDSAKCLAELDLWLGARPKHGAGASEGPGGLSLKPGQAAPAQAARRATAQPAALLQLRAGPRDKEGMTPSRERERERERDFCKAA